MDNIIPHSMEAEEAILGGLLLNNSAISQVNIPADAFYIRAHQIIYTAIRELIDLQLPADLVHLANHLSPEQLTAIGGIQKLTFLHQSTLSAINIDRYAAIVESKWQRRKLIQLCRNLIAEGQDQTIEWDDLKRKAENEISDVFLNSNNAKGLRHVSDFLPQLWQQLDEGIAPATPTGLGFLDSCLGGGLRGGELIVIAARPSMGKTFVGQFVARLFAESKPVAFFSMEMDAYSIVKRFWATESGLPQSQLTANKVAEGQIQSLVDGADRLTRLNLYIDDTPGNLVNPAFIETECHRIVREKQQPLGCVVVDYLQLIGDQGSTNRVGELGRYSSALKSLSKTFDCPVIALSQLSRGVESRNDKRPVMSDIRSSGAIEQDADVVIMLYRDEYYNPDTRDEGILELIIAKNRHGKSGVTAKANFDPSVGTITNFINYSMGA